MRSPPAPPLQSARSREGTWYTSYELTPEQFGLQRCRKEDLTGGTPAENAEIARKILQGEKGPRRNAVLLNSGAALHIARGIPMEEAIREAEKTIDSGKAPGSAGGIDLSQPRGSALKGRRRNMILDRLAASARKRVEEKKRRRPLTELQREAEAMEKNTGFPSGRLWRRKEFPLSAR